MHFPKHEKRVTRGERGWEWRIPQQQDEGGVATPEPVFSLLVVVFHLFNYKLWLAHSPPPPTPLQLGLSSLIKTPTVLPSAVCLTQQSELPPQPQLLYEVSPLLLLSFCWHKIDEQHDVNFRVTAQNFDYGVRIRLRTPSNKNTW